MLTESANVSPMSIVTDEGSTTISETSYSFLQETTVNAARRQISENLIADGNNVRISIKVNLPEEIVKRIAAGMDFRYHFVYVVPEFGKAVPAEGGDEDARDFL